MQKQVKSTSATSGLTYENGVVELRGSMLKKVLRWSKKLGVTPEHLCEQAFVEGLKPENWPAIHSAILKSRGA